jgi:hypothetical protein
VVESKSKTPPIGRFRKREGEFLLKLVLLPLGLEGEEEFG